MLHRLQDWVIFESLDQLLEDDFLPSLCVSKLLDSSLEVVNGDLLQWETVLEVSDDTTFCLVYEGLGHIALDLVLCNVKLDLGLSWNIQQLILSKVNS